MRVTLFLAIILFTSCKKEIQKVNMHEKFNDSFIISFGSCNNQSIENTFWKQLTHQKPDVWIWGGDVIYSDTEDMNVLKSNYDIQFGNSDYKNFIKNTFVMGTWDDHDYGVNDGGTEYRLKNESQQLFLDFLGINKDDIRRKRKGVYFSHVFKKEDYSVKIIVLDTRFFRTELLKDPSGKKRYLPKNDVNSTILGADQWLWLKDELFQSTSDFNIIMSSIQVLSSLHGYETWGNMPLETKKLEQLILESKAKNVILLSGDRHISEFSLKKIGSDSIPLLDFTSSGMTHSYENFAGEQNPYRVGEVMKNKSYGLILLNFKDSTATFEMWGENNKKLQQYKLKY